METELQAALVDFNHSACRPPLPPEEIQRIAASAWRYEAEGRNWSGMGGVSFARREINAIGDADALWLLVHLEFHHGAREAPLALQFRRMAAEGSIPGLGEYRLRKAAQHLGKAGFLIRLHIGGSHPGDAAQYRLRRAGPQRPGV